MDATHANNFNLIRLFAACQVFYAHAQHHLSLAGFRDIPAIGPWLQLAVDALPGVPIFFVISGYLVTQSFDASRGLGDFAWRRAMRIFPGLWIHYIVIFIALALAGNWAVAQLLGADMWRWIGAAFFVGSDWWANILSGYRPFEWNEVYARYPSGVLWTINAELGFYLLVPIVLASVWRNLRIQWLILAAFAGVSLWFAFRVTAMTEAGASGNSVGFMRNQPAPYFWVFLLGAAAAIYWRKLKFLVEGKALWWLGAYAAITAVDYIVYKNAIVDLVNFSELTIPRMVILGALVLSFAHTAPAVGKFCRSIDLSYAIYLYHMLVVFTLIGFGLGQELWVWIVVAPLVFATSALSWFLIEKPALGLKRIDWSKVASIFATPTRALGLSDRLSRARSVLASVVPIAMVVALGTTFYDFARPRPPLADFSFVAVSNWGARARGASVTVESDHSVVVTPSEAVVGYQAEAPIALSEAGAIVLRYDVTLVGGPGALGVLAGDRSRWLTNVNLRANDRTRGEVIVSAPERQVFLVIQTTRETSEGTRIIAHDVRYAMR